MRLDIRDLNVKVAGKRVLNNIHMDIDKGEIFVLFGPNGSGKSSLIKTIMGIGGYEIESGSIEFGGTTLNGLTTDERARLGISIMFQHPPGIKGVKLSQICDIISGDKEEINRYVERLNLRHLFSRDVNVNFSGGEMKRAELLQIILQRPKLILLDEPESGVDLENISLLGNAINEYLKEHKASCFVITHTGYILDYIKADKGCIMMDGHLYCSSDPYKLFETIKENGYIKCIDCAKKKEYDG